MDPKEFQNDSVRKSFAHEFCPTLSFICNIMEKHVKEDKRKEGRYNLVHLIEKVSEFNFKNVPMETLSEDDKDSLQVKAKIVTKHPGVKIRIRRKIYELIKTSIVIHSATLGCSKMVNEILSMTIKFVE